VKKVIGLILVTCLSILCGCTDNDGCSEERREVKTLDDFGCENSTYTAIILSNTDFSLIRNQEDYESVIKTICSPNIDWLRYDMIAGQLRLNTGLSSITPYMSMDCASNTVRFDIDVVTNDALNAPEVAFTAIFPKLENDQDIFVNFD